jgi:hypothetical protein
MRIIFTLLLALAGTANAQTLISVGPTVAAGSNAGISNPIAGIQTTLRTRHNRLELYLRAAYLPKYTKAYSGDGRAHELAEAGQEETRTWNQFVWKANWFVLSQTDGEAVPMPELPTWDKETALTRLNIEQVDFDHTDGNVMGYAQKRKLAVSPLAPLPHKTLFHELAHVVLGHTEESEVNDTEATPRNLREVEAESVALLLCETFELEGAEYARGYIQGWLKNQAIPERSAQKIFSAADKIIKAGQPERFGMRHGLSVRNAEQEDRL